MKLKSTKLLYPLTRTARDPAIDVVTAYAPEPSGGPCACHPGVAATWERNLYPPGWHCRFCHALPEAKCESQ